MNEPDAPARLHEGSGVILLDTRLGAALPQAAVPLLRRADAVYGASDLPAEAMHALAIVHSPRPGDLVRAASEDAVVLISGDAGQATVAALRAAGAPVLTGSRPSGVGLVEAASVMDRLRSPGGCPWDAAQTHDSLRQYLIEETYELLEAIEADDREALLEELGDVLLQVLFHARVASEHNASPFDVDDVARALVRKLVGRHPHVFGDDPAVPDAASQQVRWEELKQVEKHRKSAVDGVAVGQPAVALAAKLAQRVMKAGFPTELLPDDPLFALAAARKLGGADPEGELRAVARKFAEDVRAAENAARDAGRDPSEMDAATWRRFFSRR